MSEKWLYAFVSARNTDGSAATYSLFREKGSVKIEHQDHFYGFNYLCDVGAQEIRDDVYIHNEQPFRVERVERMR